MKPRKPEYWIPREKRRAIMEAMVAGGMHKDLKRPIIGGRRSDNRITRRLGFSHNILGPFRKSKNIPAAKYQSPPFIIKRIKELIADGKTDRQIAEQINRERIEAFEKYDTKRQPKKLGVWAVVNVRLTETGQKPDAYRKKSEEVLNGLLESAKKEMEQKSPKKPLFGEGLFGRLSLEINELPDEQKVRIERADRALKERKQALEEAEKAHKEDNTTEYNRAMAAADNREARFRMIMEELIRIRAKAKPAAKAKKS
ncbi:MAG TPA: hypothetical protein VI977_01005 [archaeon]|nr:hypothetical protein [archaeon]